jgi:hypothetical protein
MQKTLAVAPFFDPPVDKFVNLYTKWADANYGLIITGQVQIDIRFLHQRRRCVPREGNGGTTLQQVAAVGEDCTSGRHTVSGTAGASRKNESPRGREQAGRYGYFVPKQCPGQIGDSWLNKIVCHIFSYPRDLKILKVALGAR